MATKTYISRIARHQIIVKPTTKRVDGQIVPGKSILFENNRYTTDDPEEQEAIERSSDFGRLIFVEGEAPKILTPQPNNQELNKLRRENAELTAQVQALSNRLAQLEKAAKETSASNPVPAKSKGKSSSKAPQNPSVQVPKGQKCEEPGCDNDAVTENDGMFVCAEHAV